MTTFPNAELWQLVLLPAVLGASAVPLVSTSASQEDIPEHEAHEARLPTEAASVAQQLPLFQPSVSPPRDGSHAYTLLRAKAREIGWPRLWRSDLTEHDAARLVAPDAPQRFCWSVRETGTWLYSGQRGDLRHLLYWELRCMWGSRFYAYQDGMLNELSFQEAIAVVRQLEATCNHNLVDTGEKTAAPLHLLVQEAAQKRA